MIVTELAKTLKEYEVKVEKIRIRLRLYGVDDNSIKRYESACIKKAVTTVYSYFDLMDMLCCDHVTYGKLNLAQWILNDD